MSMASVKTVLITGANAGLGKDMARQFALTGGIESIYLAGRDQTKAQAAKRGEPAVKRADSDLFVTVP